MRPAMMEDVQPVTEVLAQAERCRRKAVEAVRKKPERYEVALDQPSGWCVAEE